jgi:hypothetical protein
MGTDYEIDADTQMMLDIQAEAQKDYNRQYRRMTCGRWAKLPNPQNGQKDARRQICRDFRNCLECKMRRIDEYRVRLLNEELWAEEENKQMYCVLFDVSQKNIVDRFSRKLSKQKAYYMRCPMTDNQTIAVFYAWNESLYDNSFFVTNDMIQSDQWLTPYIITPEDRKITGELGRRKENKKIATNIAEQDIEFVKTKAYAAEQMDDPAVDAIFHETREEVANEKVYDTVEEAMSSWLSLFESRCLEIGVELHVSHHEKRKVNLNRVEWIRLSRNERISSNKNHYDHIEQTRFVGSDEFYVDVSDPIPF